MACNPERIAKVGDLMHRLRDLREIQAAAQMDADDTAYHIERLRVRWSEQDKLAKTASADVEAAEHELADLIVDATSPSIMADVEVEQS